MLFNLLKFSTTLCTDNVYKANSRLDHSIQLSKLMQCYKLHKYSSHFQKIRDPFLKLVP